MDVKASRRKHRLNSLGALLGRLLQGTTAHRDSAQHQGCGQYHISSHRAVCYTGRFGNIPAFDQLGFMTGIRISWCYAGDGIVINA
jgi:hypothetical protein